VKLRKWFWIELLWYLLFSCQSASQNMLSLFPLSFPMNLWALKKWLRLKHKRGDKPIFC
jgi:hypothetical protein